MTNFIDLTADSDDEDQVNAKDQVSFQVLAVYAKKASLPHTSSYFQTTRIATFVGKHLF